MRKLILFCLLLAMGNAQAQTAFEGNGRIIKRDVAVSAFTELDASGMYELRLSQGSKEAVTVETDENLQDLFKVEQEGSRLTISMKTKDRQGINFRSKTTMIVHVTVRRLEKLDLNLMGATRSEGTLALPELKVSNKSMGELRLDLKVGHFELRNEGMGRVELKGSAEDAGIRNRGMGELNAGEFRVQSLSLANSGLGKATVNAEKEFIYKDNMMGKVKNVGGAQAVTKVN
jgi:hypothetical protein